jgi:hypothetical protein
MSLIKIILKLTFQTTAFVVVGNEGLICCHLI